jgi:hypothetical protein
MGRILDYNPSTRRQGWAQSIPVPVCAECRDHAVLGSKGLSFAQTFATLGVVAAGYGVKLIGAMPHSALVFSLVTFGTIIALVSLLYILSHALRERSDRARPGHHPRMSIDVWDGTARITTTNRALGEELMALNPEASWVVTRAEARAIPTARAIDK